MDAEIEITDDLLNEYAPRLARVAARHLDQRLAARLAPEEIVQSAFRTFFRRRGEGAIRIDSSLHLWRLLVRITIMKTRARARQHTAAQRDVAAEVHCDSNWWKSGIAAEPTEQAAVDLLELMESVLQQLPAWYADALTLRLQGYKVAEVATQTGRSQQSVYRALHVLHDRFSD